MDVKEVREWLEVFRDDCKVVVNDGVGFREIQGIESCVAGGLKLVMLTVKKGGQNAIPK